MANSLTKIHKTIKQKGIDILSVVENQDFISLKFAESVPPDQKAIAQEILEDWEDLPEPQWKTLGEQLALAPSYLRNTTHNSMTLGLKSTFELMLKISADGDLRLESIANLWNAIAQQSFPTSEEVAAINEIIKANAIDQFFSLQAEGTMILS
ncbi:MAG: hypothetical protein AAGA60_31425 [Cyanobacteria bacterium P01_E01_bin.42]